MNGFKVKCTVEITYGFVAEDAAEAIERANGYFQDDIDELREESVDRGWVRIVEIVTDPAAIRELVGESGRLELDEDAE